MTKQQHPITPPDELMWKWYDAARGPHCEQELATQAARWGADQELEACCEWLERRYNYPQADHPLRAARRPKPLSLADLAIERLELAKKYVDVDPIRRALERLQQLEQQENND